MQLISNHVFTGLQQDTSVSKCNPLYLIDAHNIRITAREGETLLSVTNEKGPRELVLKDTNNANIQIQGTIIGHCVLNDYLVLFIYNEINGDLILRIDMSKDNPLVISLFKPGVATSLGFNPDYPIEAIGDYENESILKVYWTDNLNQPRIINIANKPNNSLPKVHTWAGAFDFTPLLALTESVIVTRNTNSSGMFPAGVILYAFTYYNKYGLETNIFLTTPLYCISFYDRGGSPESRISNSFNIEVSGIDTHFDYLRIYSIMRTSINATPVVKQLLDIAIDSISGNKATYIDTGTNGEVVDPMHLLYVGGEDILAETLCSKDGTLFLGGILIKRPSIPLSIKNVIESSLNNVTTSTEAVTLSRVNYYGTYPYSNGLSAKDSQLNNTTSAGFKNREYYRLGVLFLYKNGKWSEPCFIGDKQVLIDNNPMYTNTDTLNKIIMNYSLPNELVSLLKELGYKKYRAVVVFPGMQDRTILAQGVVNGTMYTNQRRTSDKDLYAQSSWFFRPLASVSDTASLVNYSKAVIPTPNGTLPYVTRDTSWKLFLSSASGGDYMRRIEIEGSFDSDNKFLVDWSTVTFHSPEITFDDSIFNIDLSNIKCRTVGYANITLTLSDIDIQTSSPTISNSGAGFVHKSFVSDSAYGIISGLFYDDYTVDEDKEKLYRGYTYQHNSVKWLVYPWQLNGSLNNDCNRPADKGVRSAVLSKKTISNLRYATTAWSDAMNTTLLTENKLYSSGTYVPQLFSSDLLSIVKIGSDVYQGNIDTLLTPDHSDGTYFCFDNWHSTSNLGKTDITTTSTVTTPFNSNGWWKTFSLNEDTLDKVGLYKYGYFNSKYGWSKMNDHIGDAYLDLALRKDGVRMKYKSTPHIVMRTGGFYTSDTTFKIPIVELYKDYDPNTSFGGQSEDAKRANLWIPAGPSVTIATNSSAAFKWGDTWYSRYDCLKTYPFTQEDANLIVEIGSFMLETHVNIDGRYDRNRGLVNNLNMSPINFNLYNPVYSLQDNFFNYRILDNDFYELNEFPNLITWSTEKAAGVEVDPWTSITMGSTFDLDGSKGKILALNVWKDAIYCFLDKGISLILFNSRVLIPTSDNVPIEITNSYKVDGKRYIVDGVGCINKYSICKAPAALYFIDSVSGNLCTVDSLGSTSDISLLKNMQTWFKTLVNNKWTPGNYSSRVFYDSSHSDLYIVSGNDCLCYNEVLLEFTSFMSYDDVTAMYNVLDGYYCIKNNIISLMFDGDYGYFFGEYKPYDFTFVSNGIDKLLVSTDKIYTNIEFLADRWSDDFNSILSKESPFDYVRVWNEYLDTGEVLLKDIKDRPSNLKRKFRVWRIHIPRDAHNRRDRIRNTWCKIKVGSAPRYRNGNDGVVELHNLNVIYYA